MTDLRVVTGAEQDVFRLLNPRSVAVLGVIGTGLGLLVAFGAGQGIRTLLYGIEPVDYIALGIPAAGLLGLVLISGLMAASKVTRISPSLTLKSE